MDVRDCSDLSLQDVDHLLLRHSPPRPPNPPVRPRPIRRVRRRASGRRSTVPRAFAMLYMRLCRPTPARSVATRELRPTVLPPASLYAGSFTLQLDGHAPTPRQATHTNTLSEKGGDAHWSEITARSHRVLLKVGAAPDAFCPEPHDFSKLAGLRSTDSPVSSSLIVKRAFFASYAVASPHVPLSSGRPCSPYMRRRMPNLDM